MLALSDDQLAAVMEAARPLQPHQRSEFLQAVAVELARYPEIGVGIIHRVTSKIQRAHLSGPRDLRGVGGKWGH
jgi:hypothetical protein